MPGYVMHMAEARLIINALKEKKEISDIWEEAFMTGSLLPDTKLRGFKKDSHFWDPEHLDLLALGPDLDRFLEKYGDQLDNPLMLGYLAHLHLDTCYVTRFWPTSIRFLDKDGHEEARKKLITDVEVLHLNKVVSLCRFFTPDYYYGEYSKLNGYYISNYQLTIPKWQEIGQYSDHFRMDEVDLQDMTIVCEGLYELLHHYHGGDESSLQVFELDKLEAFIARTAQEFLERFGDIIVKGEYH